jgi:hypothetical protein
MLNHLLPAQILIPNICVISTLRLVTEPWLARVCAKPPPHCPNSNHSQSIISSSRLARQVASSCTLHSTENLIKKKCSHRWPMDKALGVSVPRPLEGGVKPNNGEKKILSPILSCGLKHHTKHGKKAPHELDLGSTFKQLEDKH